ncbi:ferrous iron transport protein A [Bacillus infantis]|uniref:FeoA family protein n=1 Tax=Bacillus infantis TaxID=324767 RepID=UPI001CD7E1AD|nr:FeoA family protein [Bacillus infantis]MCA1042521.1 ferrous iron transport protein A [Bacillus infantis]
MNLNELKVGDLAKIVNVSQVQGLIQKRLSHLGISENAEICVKNKQPFGGPCMIDCQGQCVSLRRNDASCIQVELVCK